jgi:hypothetical protein
MVTSIANAKGKRVKPLIESRARSHRVEVDCVHDEQRGAKVLESSSFPNLGSALPLDAFQQQPHVVAELAASGRGRRRAGEHVLAGRDARTTWSRGSELLGVSFGGFSSGRRVDVNDRRTRGRLLRIGNVAAD